jgi:hypothetical protein
MEAIYFGNDIGWNREGHLPFANQSKGPYIGADIENGMYEGDDYIDWSTIPTWNIRWGKTPSIDSRSILVVPNVLVLFWNTIICQDRLGTNNQRNSDNKNDTTLCRSYVTAMLKGRNCEFALKGADAQAGALTDLYDGVRPQHNNYSPMKLQGNIILGTGGDNSEGAEGTFFEGAMTVRKRPA